MFNYTTELILNDLTKVKVLLGALSAPASGVMWDPGIEATKKALFIERLNKFIVAGTKDLVVDAKIYKRAASAATLSSSKITIPTATSGVLYRVGVSITTNGYADGQFARDRVTYGKPFYVEYVATTTTASTLATALANAWNKAFETYDNFVTATTNSAELIFTADNNPYIKFSTIILESIDTTTGAATLLTNTVTVVTTGAPAFGDWSDLTKSHRLPTIDNYRPFGTNQEELPIVGATYNQFTLEYKADRGNMGQSVVGQNAVSTTTHVIWVNAAAAEVTRHISGTSGQTGTYSFEEMCQAAGLSVINAVTGADETPTAVTEA